MEKVLTIDLFKWIVGLLMSVVIGLIYFQQQEIISVNSKMDAYQNKLDSYQNSIQTTIWPSLTAINVNLGKMSTDIDWIKRSVVAENNPDK